ncbi:hypothetical protein DFH06DRAFT_1142290 [Mycena polygramma]|nr:hypothetical protein DFH06DRAFT_1142290 [Mycena polygramma]
MSPTTFLKHLINIRVFRSQFAVGGVDSAKVVLVFSEGPVECGSVVWFGNHLLLVKRARAFYYPPGAPGVALPEAETTYVGKAYENSEEWEGEEVANRVTGEDSIRLSLDSCPKILFHMLWIALPKSSVGNEPVRMTGFENGRPAVSHEGVNVGNNAFSITRSIFRNQAREGDQLSPKGMSRERHPQMQGYAGVGGGIRHHPMGARDAASGRVIAGGFRGVVQRRTVYRNREGSWHTSASEGCSDIEPLSAKAVITNRSSRIEESRIGARGLPVRTRDTAKQNPRQRDRLKRAQLKSHTSPVKAKGSDHRNKYDPVVKG